MTCIQRLRLLIQAAPFLVQRLAGRRLLFVLSLKCRRFLGQFRLALLELGDGGGVGSLIRLQPGPDLLKLSRLLLESAGAGIELRCSLAQRLVEFTQFALPLEKLSVQDIQLGLPLLLAV
jgi:hypothetical protein